MAMLQSSLESLIAAALDDRLDASQRAELNQHLRNSHEARLTWHRLARVHAALHRFADSGETLTPIPLPAPARKPWKITLALAASISLMAAAWFYNPKKPTGPDTFAEITTRHSQWEGMSPKDGPLPSDIPLFLKAGFASLTFSSGVEVTLEAPCRFTIHGPLSMAVDHGRAAIKVPEPVDQFTVRTPGGDFVDLGTEFGIAVGSDGQAPVILTDVYEGEIEIRPASLATQRLIPGHGRALLGTGSGAQLVANLDSDPISLADLHRQLPANLPTSPSGENLALGKPVFAPAYLTRPHGSVFPPDNLTDGRTDDSGVPGDWSFWLAPDHEAGSFTIDLLETHQISRVDLQNTRNRNIGDRGLKRFRLLISNDNRNFTPVLEASLDAIPLETRSFPFQSFTFPSVTARYVKIEGIDHYRSPARPVNDPHQGGGLNEIRIFEK
jgi:hypothetical protein